MRKDKGRLENSSCPCSPEQMLTGSNTVLLPNFEGGVSKSFLGSFPFRATPGHPSQPKCNLLHTHTHFTKKEKKQKEEFEELRPGLVFTLRQIKFHPMPVSFPFNLLCFTRVIHVTVHAAAFEGLRYACSCL